MSREHPYVGSDDDGTDYNPWQDAAEELKEVQRLFDKGKGGKGKGKGGQGERDARFGTSAARWGDSDAWWGSSDSGVGTLPLGVGRRMGRNRGVAHTMKPQHHGARFTFPRGKHSTRKRPPLEGEAAVAAQQHCGAPRLLMRRALAALRN